jgi:hypothetical protein
MSSPDHTSDFARGLSDVFGLPGVAQDHAWSDDFVADASPAPVGDFNSGLDDTDMD